MIALLCPSKGRPEKLKRMIESARATASTQIQVYMAIGQDDVASYVGINDSKFIMPDLMPTGFKWNFLAQQLIQHSPAIKLFMIAGDDMIFDTPGWDKALIDHYNNLPTVLTGKKQPHVYHLQDSRDENGTPHPIISREYIEAMDYFVPPWFLHWHIDTWTVEIAQSQNCFTHLKDYMLIHDKDSDKGQPDSTHTGIRSYGWRERDNAVDKVMRSAGLFEAEKNRFWSHAR